MVPFSLFLYVHICILYIEYLGAGKNSKVAFLCPNSAVYSVVQWGCWISGQIGNITFNYFLLTQLIDIF